MNCRQEVVPGHRAAGLTLERPTKTQSVLFRSSQSQVNRWEHRKDVGLDDRNEQMESDEQDRDGRWKNSENDAEDHRLTPPEAGSTRKESQENQIDEIAGEHVRPETNREREEAR